MKKWKFNYDGWSEEGWSDQVYLILIHAALLLLEDNEIKCRKLYYLFAN